MTPCFFSKMTFPNKTALISRTKRKNLDGISKWPNLSTIFWKRNHMQNLLAFVIEMADWSCLLCDKHQNLLPLTLRNKRDLLVEAGNCNLLLEDGLLGAWLDIKNVFLDEQWLLQQIHSANNFDIYYSLMQRRRHSPENYGRSYSRSHKQHHLMEHYNLSLHQSCFCVILHILLGQHGMSKNILSGKVQHMFECSTSCKSKQRGHEVKK